MKLILVITIFTNLLLAQNSVDINIKISLCANEKNDKKRLICFDKLSKDEKSKEFSQKENKNKSATGFKKNKRIEKLINMHPDIEKIYNNILYTNLMKDKFETSSEYKARLDNPEFNTHAIMAQEARKQYDADKKLFRICLNGPDYSQSGLFTDFFKGDSDPNYKYIGHRKEKFGKNELRIVFPSPSLKHKNRSFAIHPDNFQSIIKIKDFSIEKESTSYATTCLNIPADKEMARDLDSHIYIAKLGVTFTKIRTRLYSDRLLNEKDTKDIWNFSGHINEFVIYNKDSKKVLAQYTD